MRDELDPVDVELTRSLRSYVRRAVTVREPDFVVAQVLSARSEGTRLRIPRWSAPAAILVVLVALIGAGGVAYLGGGSEVATARVGGNTYYLAVARNLDVPSELLEAYGAATEIEFDAAAVLSPTVYAIRGIDPATVLLLPVTPGAQDDAGPLGEFFLLTNGANALRSICPYFDDARGPLPRACQ